MPGPKKQGPHVGDDTRGKGAPPPPALFQLLQTELVEDWLLGGKMEW